MNSNFDEKTATLLDADKTKFDPSTAKPYEPPKTTGLGLTKDIGLSLAKGAASLPGAIMAMPDALLTGGKAGKYLEDKGLNFGDQAQAYFDKQHTDALKTKREEFEQAGSDEDTRMGKILDKAGYAISNPSLLVNTAAESIPSMIAGAKIGRAVGGKSMSGEAAGALGEGYMMAGQAAEEIRSNTEDRLLTPEQTGLAALTGVAGGLFSLAGNSLAKSAGLADVDTLLANGVKPTDIAKNLSTMPPKSIPGSMIKGAISEGLLEELPQTITEKALQNIALGKDWDDGIEGDVVLGTLTGNMIGGLTSGAGAAMSRNQSNGVPEPQEQGETDNSPENEPLNTGGGAITQPVQDYALSPEFAAERPYQPTLAEQAGLNPDDGSLSEAASVAVNGGAALLNSPVLEGEAIPYDGGIGYEQKKQGSNTYGVDAYGNVNYANGTDIYVPASQSKQIEFNDNWRGRAPVYEVDSDGNAMPTSGEAAASRKERFDLSGIDGRPLRGANDKPQQNQATTQANSQAPEQVAQSIWDGMNSYERNNAAVSTLKKRGVLAKNAASRNWEKLDQGDKDLLIASLSEQQGLRWTDPNQKATDSSLPVLQNRDRSSAASVEQMASISSSPDYYRVGVSRDFGNGAPVLEESETLPAQQIGRSDVSVTAQGRQIPVKYAVVEAQQILPSNTASGASIPEYSTGQAGKLRAIAGNGRSAGLIDGWRKGTTENYLNAMLNDDLHGIDPSVIRSMKEPVLVRLMQSSDVTENIGDESNIANQATLGAIEQAKTDARRIDLSSLEFDEDNITDKSLQGFIAGMPISDRSALMDGKLPSKLARARMEAAIFHQAYNNDELTRVQAQAITDESRNIINALMQAAPAMSKLDGAGEFDIRALVSEAASVAVNARRSGAKLKDYIAQNDFGRNPEIQPLLEMMAANINSAKNMAEKLKNLAAIAYAESMKGGVDLFGEVKKPSTSQLMNLAFNGVQIDEREQNTDGSGQGNLGQQSGAESNALDAEQPTTHSGRTAGGKPIETAQPEPTSTNQQEVKTEPWRRNYIAAAKRARELGIDPRQYKELGALIAQIEVQNVPKLRATEIQDDFSPDFNQDFDLTTQTEEELADQAERIKQAENEAKAEQAAQESEASKKQNKANDKQQADATLDNFELGQSGEAQLSGMDDLLAIDQAANEAATDPDAFIKTKDGEMDFGEITPEMAKAAGRQAGKIRLQEGDEKFGRKHIELRHGEEIKQAGFDSIESFVREIASNIDQVWKPEKTRQLVAIQSTGNNRILFVELQPEENGGEDFYTVKTAYTSRQGGKSGWSLLWEAEAKASNDAGNRSSFAEPSQERASEKATNLPSQSNDASVDQNATAEQERGKSETPTNAEITAAANEAATDPDAFIKTKDGEMDFGEITPEMAKAAGRQAGKIRLQEGIQNPDGTGYGLAHIEANHGKQIRTLGFSDAVDFVQNLAGNFSEIWKAKSGQLLVTVNDGRKDVMFIQLSPSENGDFYRVNSAFPVRQKDYEQRKGMEKLWGGSEPAPVATGQQPAFATETPNKPSEASPNARSQSSGASVGQNGQAEQGSNPAEPIDEKEATQTQPAERIDDFGEKIAGARKDYASKLKDAQDLDIATNPFAKVWPEPNYQKLIDGGMKPEHAALIRAIRDEIPAKPRHAWKLKQWVKQVQTLRESVTIIMADPDSASEFAKRIEENNVVSGIAGRATLYEALGHEESLKDYSLKAGSYGVFNGVRYSPNKTFWTVSKEGKGGRFESILASGETKAEALADYLAKRKTAAPKAASAAKGTTFDIYTDRYTKDVFIGKKIGTKIARIKTGFATVKEARLYKAEHQAELEERLAKFKDVPNERNETNAPRVGIDHRNGANVTPEQFGETFGFRGVQFGNSVEQKRRQQDLNDAYDGLMDLAGILNLPPKALSLNGELALAFGARGIGGKHPFKAHYEPGEVVINLTKGNGAGSLAHEWWHALDNYFAKDRNGGKAPDFYGTEHGYHSSTRQEMKEAFAAIASAVNRAGIKARSQKLDTTRTKAYWSTGREMTARAFESYIIEKLRDQNQSNDYLANIVSEDYWNAAAALGVEKGNTYPYPEAAELPGIRAAYESFFQTIEHKETDDGDVLLFSRTPATKAAYESRIDALFNGSKPNQQGVTVLDRSDVLDLLGFGDMPVVLNEKHAINDGRFNHPLTAEQWKRIPDYLENPVAVFERDDGNLTFVTSELVDGKPLIVGISPEVGMIGGRSVAKQHLLLTAYVRDRGDLPVKRMINDGELRYVDTRKSPEFNAGSGLQIPSSGIDLRGLGYKVHTGADLFKYRQDNQTNYRMDAPDVVTSGMTRAQAQAIADKVLGGKNDDVIIVQSFKDLPEDVKRAVALDGTSDDGFNALHFKGKSYIVADAMKTAAEVEAAIFHEHYTHGGLRAKYGKDLGKKLDDMLTKAGGIVGLRMQAKKQGINLHEYEKALARNPSMDAQTKKRILMEELLAHMSATTGTLRRRLEEILGAIRQWLRDNGFAELAKLNASDMAYTLKQAREAMLKQDSNRKLGNTQPAYQLSQARNAIQQPQTETAAFKKWFGDSKVVDDQGKPLVVYHGTGADFDSFSNEKKAGGQLGNGFYFAPTSSGANMFAKIRKMRDTNAAPSVIPAYVSIQNPYIIDGRGSIPINGINAELLADMGHDGVMVMKGGAIDEITAFNPEQIKSAIGNNGSFDGTNPDITYLRAFHGSPHLFNEFDLEKIGDGVGAQAYGYGLYFAGSEDVARFYKEQSYGEGNLYQVDIPEVDDLLNYDKPLSQQPEQVKAGVKAMLKRPEAVLFTATQKAVEGNATGEAIYRALAKDLGSQQEASAAFNKAGIPGLTYQGIEHRVVGGKGSRNYVIWDDSLVDMEAINGQRAQAQALFGRKTPPDGFAPKQGEADKYRGNLKRLMRSLRTNEPAIEVTSMPKVLQQMGVGNAPITISRDVVRKATNGVKHNVPMSAIERLPEELHDPLAVFESATEDGALVVLTELQDESGRSVIVALDLRKAGNEYGIARISSLYGKDNFAGWVSKNKLAYKSKRASGSHLLKQALVHESSVLKGLQLPNSVSDTRGSGKVLTEDDILSNDDPVMFSRTSAARDNLASKAEAVLNAADKWADRERVIPNDWTDAQKAAAGKFDTFTPRQPFSSKLKQIRNAGKDRFVQKVFDQFRPLKDLSKKAYMQAQLAKGHAGALEAVATLGTPYLRDGAIAVRQDENGFIGKLSKLGDMEEVRKFLMWVAANRAEKLMSEGRENLFSRDDIDAMKAFATGTLKDGRARAAAYAQAAQELRKYNKAVLDIAEQAGLVNADSRETWESDFYIPFYRVLEDENGTPSRKHSHADARLVRQEVIKRLKGGTDNLGDPLENILANWGSLLGASMRNMAASEALKEGETLGISSKVGEQDFAAGERGNTWTMQNGQRVYWHVYDAPVMEALEAMSFTGYDNPFMKAAGAFKRALTTGVTISPVFRANNLVRDLVHSMAVADVSYNPLKNLADGWKMTSKGTDSMAQLLAGGGAIRFGSFTDGNAGDVVKRMIKSGIEDHQILNTPEKFKHAIAKFFTSYQEFGDRAETVNRAAVYQRVLAETGSHLEASFAARDLMNFSSMGSAAVIRAMAQVLPFFNARLQGMDRLVRGAADNPMRFAKVVGVLGAASALLFLMQADDDEYKALPDYVRDTYWPVKLGGTWLYIPKPFEVGALATVIERGTELMTAGNDYQAKDFAATLTSTLVNTLAMNPVPQIIRPAMESWFNYDMFRGRPIDSMGMERLLPQDRYDANTSAGAVALGQALNSSPQKIEHMVRGYFGWLGLQALNVTDILGRSLTDMPASGRRDLSQINNWFVVGNVAKESGTLPSKYVERFYDMQREINELYQSANAARKAGNTDRYNELMGDPKMKARNMLNSANNRITLINRQIKAITARADLSAKEKNEAIQRLNERRNAIAKQVDDMARA